MELSSFIGKPEWLALKGAYQDKRVITQPSGSPERFKPLWSEWELEAMYRFTLLPESDTFRLFTRGKQVSASAYRDRDGASKLAVVRQLWASGVSINFARLELYSNPVLALSRGLEAAFGCPVRVHFFMTPPQAQGLGVHADHGDVLVLQVQGQKTWDIYHGSNDWSSDDPAVIAEKLRSHPPESVTLQAGGWLYLPEGVYHEVRNKGAEPSTHFTIGFHELPWAALLEQTLAVAQRSLPSLKETVAVAGLFAESQEEIGRRLLALSPFVDVALQSNHYGRPVPPADLVLRQKLEAAGLASRFVWQKENVIVKAISARIELKLPYRTVPLTLRVEFEPLITRMIQLGTFFPTDLSHDGEVVLLLCKFLTNLGILRLAEG